MKYINFAIYACKMFLINWRTCYVIKTYYIIKNIFRSFFIYLPPRKIDFYVQDTLLSW